MGLHQPSDCDRLPAGQGAFVSVKRLKMRRTAFHPDCEWIMDSGAFTELAQHGRYRSSVRNYAAEIRRWAVGKKCLAAVAQDYMCETFILEKTGLTVADHQRLTIERYDELLRCLEWQNPGVYIMPVLQGYAPTDYVEHLRQYGDRLKPGMWVGVGSVCKRNGDIQAIKDVLNAIKTERPDLLLHGFGIKTIALSDPEIAEMLFTADSMAWSLHARINGRDGNSVNEAIAFASRINAMLGAHSANLSLLQVKVEHHDV